MCADRPSLLLGLVGALLAAGCSDYGYTEVEQHDFFQQSRLNAIDLLVVVDNSCSMVQEQDNLARNFDTLIDTFASADVDWQIAVTTTDVEGDRYRGLLMGGDDEIVLRGPQGEIDRIEYDRTWPFEPGVALSFPSDDFDRFRFTFNDNHLNWCPATESFGDGHLGTPGAWNPGCDGEPAFAPPAEVDDQGPRDPRGGELVISEVMPWSDPAVGTDERCEWFEIANRTGDTLLLSDLEVFDLGRNRIAGLPSDATIEPYGVAVFGRAGTGNCGTPVDWVVPGFVLNHDVRHLTPDTPGAADLFGENVAQGTIGTGIEMGLEAARLSFLGHESTLPDEGGGGDTQPGERQYYVEDNGEWLRDEASLAILFVSDEDDVSPWPVDSYVRFFGELKGQEGHRDDDLVTLSGVVATEPPPREDLPSCSSENGEAWYGRRYLEASNVTHGLTESICETDFSPIVERLGLTLSGLELEFELSEWPRPDTLVVELYSDEDLDALVATLEPEVDYTYDPDCNSIRFDETQVPPAEWFVVARYTQLPSGVEPTGANPEECVP